MAPSDPRGSQRAGRPTGSRPRTPDDGHAGADLRHRPPDQDDCCGSGRPPTGAIPSACRCRPCRPMSPWSGRPAAARRGWRRSWPRRRSAGVPVLAIDPQGDLVQFLRPADDPEGSPPRRGLAPRVPRPGRAAGLDARHVARPEAQPRPDPPGRPRPSSSGRAGPARGGMGGDAGRRRRPAGGLAKIGGEEDSQQTFVLQLLRADPREAGPRSTWGGSPPRSRARGVRPGGPRPVHQEGRAGEAGPQAQRPAARPGGRPLYAAGPASTWTPSAAPRARARRR